MKDQSKTKQVLIQELVSLRQRIAELEQSGLERKRMDVALLNSIIEGTTDAIYAKDLQGRYILCNAATGRAVGKSVIEILGNDDLTLFPPSEALSIVESDRKVIERGSVKTYETVLTIATGQKVTYLSTKGPLFDAGGKCIGLFGLTRDITDRKRAEQVIQDEKQLSESIINSLPGIFYLFNAQGEFLRWNRNFEMVGGYSHQEMLERHPSDFFTGEDKELVQQRIQETFVNGKANVEAHFVSRSGAGTPYFLTGVRIEINGQPHLMGMGFDIAERKQTEEAIVVAKNDWENTFNTVTDIITIHDDNFNIVRANPAARAAFGMQLQDGTPLAKCFSSYHGTKNPPTECPSCQCIQTGKPCTVEIFEPYLQKHLEIRAMPRFGSDGRVVGLIHVVRDITERNKAHETLLTSEQTARQLSKENELMAEIGKIISSTLNIEEVYERFADKVKELIPFDRIAINTINMKDYTRTIRYVQGDAFAGNRIGEVISLVGTGVEEIIRTKSSMIVNNTSTEDIKEKLLLAFTFGAQSTMLIPLILKDEVVGSLAIHSAEADAYSAYDLRLAERMASQIAGSIANAQLFHERVQVEEKLRDTLESLRKSMSAAIQVMVATVEARDPYTAGHQIRSADLARAIATEMGLPREKIEGLRMAGSIHDIGKISIPAEILSKPTKLSEIEFSLIKEHARRGYEMLKGVESSWPLAEIVYQHHERMDGSGYPRNLQREDIMIEARILTVADVVEAMASHRPYRPGLGIDAALSEIEKNSGIFYDKTVADACLRLFREKGFQLEVA